jgi:hypothetical protein
MILAEEEGEVRLSGVMVGLAAGELDGNVVGDGDIAEVGWVRGGGIRIRGGEGLAGVGDGGHGGAARRKKERRRLGGEEAAAG